MSASFRPSLSLVSPVFNEVESLTAFVEEIHATLADYPADWEMILVDDGSRDGSTALLGKLADAHSHLRPVYLRRNFGQTAAMSAGIDAAQHQVIITLDADMQNVPADISSLLDKMGEGFDVVSGWRAHRADGFFLRTLPSKAANWLISVITGVRLHDYGCTLKAYDAPTIKGFRLYGEMHRFLPALCTWRGALVAEIPVQHRPRTRGISKYGLRRTYRVLLDLVTVKFLLEYSTKPMRIFGAPGLLCMGSGLAINAYMAWVKLVLGAQIGHRPLLLLGLLLMVVGVQLVMLGLLSELLIRVYFESQGKTVYELARPTDIARRSKL